MYFWGSNTPILIDFITMAIVTYSIRLPRTSAMGHIASLARVAVFLGMLMVAESCWATLYIWMSPSGLTGNIGLHTFVFDMLIFGGMFTIHVVRENVYFLGVYSQQKTHDSYMCRYGRNFCHLNLWDSRPDTDSCQFHTDGDDLVFCIYLDY